MDRKSLAAIAAAFALGAGGATVAHRPTPPATPVVIADPILDACLRPPLRAKECAKLLGRDAGP